MEKLKNGRVYMSSLREELVVYLGLIKHDNGKYYYQFEYVNSPHKYLAGYGQDTRQLIEEDYKYSKVGTLLYGR